LKGVYAPTAGTVRVTNLILTGAGIGQTVFVGNFGPTPSTQQPTLNVLSNGSIAIFDVSFVNQTGNVKFFLCLHYVLLKTISMGP
jgi:hypothetical protein